MKKLNKKSTQFFCSLVDRMSSRNLKIKNEPFSPLFIRHIGEAYFQEGGVGMLYSLCQYSIHYGDILMKEPEMCFAFADVRQQLKDYHRVAIFPYKYMFEVFGIHEQSIAVKGHRFEKADKEKQASHVAYANNWLHLLQSQGY